MLRNSKSYKPSDSKIRKNLKVSLEEIRGFLDDIQLIPLRDLLGTEQYESPEEPKGDACTTTECIAQLLCEEFERLVTRIRAEEDLSDADLLVGFPCMMDPNSTTPRTLLYGVRNRNAFYKPILEQLQGPKNTQTRTLEWCEQQLDQFLEQHQNTPLRELLPQTKNPNEPLDDIHERWKSIVRRCPEGFTECISQLPPRLSKDHFRSNPSGNRALKRSITTALRYWEEQLNQYRKPDPAHKPGLAAASSTSSGSTDDEYTERVLTRISSVFGKLKEEFNEASTGALRPEPLTRQQQKDRLNQIRAELCNTVGEFIALKLRADDPYLDLLSMVQAHYYSVEHPPTEFADTLEDTKAYLSLNKLLVDAQDQNAGLTRTAAVEACLQAIMEEISTQTGHTSGYTWDEDAPPSPSFSTVTLAHLHDRIADWTTLETAIKEALDQTVNPHGQPGLTKLAIETDEVTPIASAMLEEQGDVPAVHLTTEHSTTPESDAEDLPITDFVISATKTSILSPIPEEADPPICDIPDDAVAQAQLRFGSENPIAKGIETASSAAHISEESSLAVVGVSAAPEDTNRNSPLNTPTNTAISSSCLVPDEKPHSPDTNSVSRRTHDTGYVSSNAPSAPEDSMEWSKEGLGSNAVLSDEVEAISTGFKTEANTPTTEESQSSVYSPPDVTPAIVSATVDACAIDAATQHPPEKDWTLPPAVSTGGNAMQEASYSEDQLRKLPSSDHSLEHPESTPSPAQILLEDNPFPTSIAESTEHHARADVRTRMNEPDSVVPSLSTTPVEGACGDYNLGRMPHTDTHPVYIKSETETQDIPPLSLSQQHSSDTDIRAIPFENETTPASSHAVQDYLGPCVAEDTKNNEETMKLTNDTLLPTVEISQTDSLSQHDEIVGSASDETVTNGDTSLAASVAAENLMDRNPTQKTDIAINPVPHRPLLSPEDSDDEEFDLEALKLETPQFDGILGPDVIGTGSETQQEEDAERLSEEARRDRAEIAALIEKLIETNKPSQSSQIDTPSSSDRLMLLEQLAQMMAQHDQIGQSLIEHHHTSTKLSEELEEVGLALVQEKSKTREAEDRARHAEQSLEDLHNTQTQSASLLSKLNQQLADIYQKIEDARLDKQKSGKQSENSASLQSELAKANQTLVELKDTLRNVQHELTQKIDALPEQLRMQTPPPLPHNMDLNVGQHARDHSAARQPYTPVAMPPRKQEVDLDHIPPRMDLSANNSDTPFQFTGPSDRIEEDTEETQVHVERKVPTNKQKNKPTNERTSTIGQTQSTVYDGDSASEQDQDCSSAEQQSNDGDELESEDECLKGDSCDDDGSSATLLKQQLGGNQGTTHTFRGDNSGTAAGRHSPPAYATTEFTSNRATRDYTANNPPYIPQQTPESTPRHQGHRNNKKMIPDSWELFYQVQKLLLQAAEGKLTRILTEKEYEATPQLRDQLKSKITSLLQSDFLSAHQTFLNNLGSQDVDSGVESISSSPERRSLPSSAGASRTSSPAKNSTQSEVPQEDYVQTLIGTVYLPPVTNPTEGQENAEVNGEDTSTTGTTSDTLLNKTFSIASEHAKRFIEEQTTPSPEQLEKIYHTISQILLETERELAIAQLKLPAKQLEQYIRRLHTSIEKVQDQIEKNRFSAESAQLARKLTDMREEVQPTCCPLTQDRTVKQAKSIRHAIEHVAQIQDNHAALQERSAYLLETAETLQNQPKALSTSAEQKQVLVPSSASYAHRLIVDPDDSAAIDKACWELREQLSSDSQNLILCTESELYKPIVIQDDQVLMLGAQIKQTANQEHTLIMKVCVRSGSDRFYMHSIDQEPAYNNAGFFSKRKIERTLRKPACVETVAKLTWDMVQSSSEERLKVLVLNLNHPAGLECYASYKAWQHLYPGATAPRLLLQFSGLNNETLTDEKKYKAFKTDLESRVAKKIKEFEDQPWQAHSDARANLNNSRTTFRREEPAAPSGAA